MSTKAKIQKVRAEVEAHEERGWLKGYEEGLAKREQQIVDLQSALEARNERFRELSHQKNGPKTAQEALERAWDLAHPVKAGQTITSGTRYLHRSDLYPISAGVVVIERQASLNDEATFRTLDPLPEPEARPEWTNAPAVLAFYLDYGCLLFERENETGTQWVRNNKVYHWYELEDAVPLYPKEDA